MNDAERLAQIKADLDKDIIPPLEHERVRPYQDDPLGHRNELLTVAQVNDAMRLWAKRVNMGRESLNSTEVLKRLLVLRAWRQTLLSDPIGKWAKKIAQMEKNHEKEVRNLKELCNSKIKRARELAEKKYKWEFEQALKGVDAEYTVPEGQVVEEFALEEGQDEQ